MGSNIKVFEPAMCCSTGTCGPTVDEKVVAFNDLIAELAEKGCVVQRYSISRNIDEFQKEAEVMDLLKEEPTGALPITVINGKVIKKGSYPILQDIVANMRS